MSWHKFFRFITDTGFAHNHSVSWVVCNRRRPYAMGNNDFVLTTRTLHMRLVSKPTKEGPSNI